MKEKPPPKKLRTVEIVRSDYQPSKAELAAPIVLGSGPIKGIPKAGLA